MRFSAIILLSILMIIFSCSKKQQNVSNDKIKVFVSIAPEKFFVEKIGNNLVDVSVLVPPGSSPHTYEPRPSQMAGISKAKILFTIGVEFEKAWIPRIRGNAKNLLIVPLDSGIEKIPMAEHHDENGGRENADQNGLDPHIWVSPELVKIMALKITNALSTTDPAHKEVYKSNYIKFIKDLTDLQNNIRNTLAACPRPLPFMVFHPSWGYFAREFDLQEIPIEIEGKEPSPKELAQIVSIAKEKHIKTIFIQPQFSAQSAKQIAHEIGGQTAVADNLSENWDENLIHIAQLIGKCK